MLIKNQPLDWKRLQHIGTSITWEADTYNHFKAKPDDSQNPTATEMEWHSLPFEEVQLDKFPERPGVYAFTFKYLCLGFPEREIILYVGEAENLRSRLEQHVKLAKVELQNINQIRPVKTHTKRLKYLFSTFEGLAVRYCAVNATEEERMNLEKDLIGLLDPPFNWLHRPRPTREPTIGRPGTILINPAAATPAFANRSLRRTR